LYIKRKYYIIISIFQFKTVPMPQIHIWYDLLHVRNLTNDKSGVQKHVAFS